MFDDSLSLYSLVICISSFVVVVVVVLFCFFKLFCMGLAWENNMELCNNIISDRIWSSRGDPVRLTER